VSRLKTFELYSYHNGEFNMNTGKQTSPQESLDDAINDITADDSMKPESKEKLLKSLRRLKSPLEYDRWIYRMVVLFLGVTVVATVVGGFMMASLSTDAAQKDIPEGLIALGSAAVGALAGLLAPAPNGK
jgi:hypothetical protein